GLDYHKAFRQLEAMHFRVIRLSAYWDQIDQEGYAQLDWLMNEAQRSRQPVVLAVGMKGLGWPEFYVPVSALPPDGLTHGQDAARQGFDLRQWLGFEADSAEKDGLSVLNKGDVLGLDVYTAIGYHFLGQDQMSHADGDWPDRLARVRDLVKRQGKQAWITEAQAEPWESGP